MWSLGISLIELALGRFPFADSSSDDSDLSDFEGTLSPSRPAPLPTARKTQEQKDRDKKKKKRKSRGVSLQGGGMTMSILELLQHIVNEPAPRLTPEGRFPQEAEDFVDRCLLKDPEQRRTPKDLLVSALFLNRDQHVLSSIFRCAETPMGRARASISNRPRGVGIHVLAFLAHIYSSRLLTTGSLSAFRAACLRVSLRSSCTINQCRRAAFRLGVQIPAIFRVVLSRRLIALRMAICFFPSILTLAAGV